MIYDLQDETRRDFQGMTPLEYVVRFSPFIKSLATRYVGRGAEYDDLMEEGYASLLQLGYRCPEEEPLARYLARRLPGKVRDSAARYRKEAFPLSLDEMIDVGIEVADESTLEPYISTELLFYGIKIKREDFLLAEDLIRGMTQTDIAKDLGISQQAVSRRIAKFRAFLIKTLNLDINDLHKKDDDDKDGSPA